MLVTGGAGFIGSHLVDALLERGAVVRVLDDLSNGSLENLDHCIDRISFSEGDICDLDKCRELCDGVTYVFHQAALGSVPRSMSDPATSLKVNVTGTANVFAAARDSGVRRVVFASSSSVYGDGAKLPKREGEEGKPLSPYALSKVMNEELADTFARCFAMELIGLRYFNVYGPRQRPDGPYAAVVPRFFCACLAGKSPVIYGNGEQSRDFSFVADTVRVNLLAAGAPTEALARSYNVAPGVRTSVRELARLVRAAVGNGGEPLHVEPRPGDVPHSMADPGAAQQMLGFSTEVDLTTGLALTSEWYRKTAGRKPERLGVEGLRPKINLPRRC